MLLNTFLYAAVAHILEVAQKPSLGSTTIYEASCQLPGLGEDFFISRNYPYDLISGIQAKRFW